MTENYTNMIEAITKLGDEELGSLHTYITDLIKTNRQKMGAAVKSTLSIGDHVLVKHKGQTDEGEIIKLNRKRAIVKMVKGSYSVPYSMIGKKD